MTRAIAIVILVASFLTALPVASQDLKPLKDTLANSGPVYVATRCAGLYLSLVQWIGEERIIERMGEQQSQKMMSAIGQYMGFAVDLGQPESGSSVEEFTSIVTRDAANIAGLYLTRMERNYAASGQGFGEDPLINGDLDLCKFLGE